MLVELLAVTLLRAQLAAAAGVLVVLALRVPVRRLVGAEAAYKLWRLAPIAALVSVFPSLSEALKAGSATQPPERLLAVAMLAVWIVGVVGLAGFIALGERAFRRRARAGLEGPAVMGVFCPRLVIPHDFAQRFDAGERELVLAHERAHMRRGDPRGNLIITVLQVLGWLNPFVHLGAAIARLDQEIACDADVVALTPKARKRYAETLMKAHACTAASPLACAFGRHPLVARVRVLAGPGPVAAEGLTVTIAALTVMTVLAVWTLAPRGLDVPAFRVPGGTARLFVDGVTPPPLHRNVDTTAR